MSLALVMAVFALAFKSLAMMVLAVFVGIVAVAIICWRNVIVHDVPPGSPDDHSEEFQLLPGHPANVRSVLVPSTRVGFLIWLVINISYYVVARYITGYSIILSCGLTPGLFVVLVVIPWIHFRHSDVNNN